MTSKHPLWWLVGLFVAGMVVLGGGSAITAAQEDGASASADEPTTIGSFDIAVENERFVLSDVHVSGDGFPEFRVDERHYTVHDATFHTDGFVFTVNGERFQVCELTVTLATCR